MRSAFLRRRGDQKIDFRSSLGLWRWITGAEMRPYFEVLVLAALQACGRVIDLDSGRRIHGDVVEAQADVKIYVSNTLISMYAKCRAMDEANKVFNGIQVRSVVSWNALILGYAENGKEELALEFFRLLVQGESCEMNARTFTAAAKACSGLAEKEAGTGKMAALELGKEIYDRAGKMGYDSEMFVASTFIDMFARCRSMTDSHEVFRKTPHRDQACWNALMLGYVDNGDEKKALELFSLMEAGGCLPNARSFAAALRACSGLGRKEQELKHVDKGQALQVGMTIHARVSKFGFENEGFVASTLIDMYIKCGSLRHARTVFDKVASRCHISWNSMILGYAENEDEDEALRLFFRMGSYGHARDSRSLVAALKACSSLAEKEGGKQVHEKVVKVCALEKVMGIHIQARKAGFETDVFVASALVDAYAKCVSMLDARKVFDCTPLHSVVSWTALIRGCAENDDENLALDLFFQMPSQGCLPSVWTFVAFLQACSAIAEKGKGDKVATVNTVMDIHSQAKHRGYYSDIFLLSSLVDAYAKCSSVHNARDVFNSIQEPDSVAWNSLIRGYVGNGEELTALELYARMPENSRDSRTYVAALKACSLLAQREEPQQQGGSKSQSLSLAMKIHKDAAKAGCVQEIFVATTLVDTFAKCGSMRDSRGVYDGVPAPNAALWTALLLGYVENWEEEEILQLLEGMPVEADAQAFVVALKACSTIALREEITKLANGSLVKLRALERGSAIHRQASKCGTDSDVVVANTLIDMYGKCWSMVDAWRVFDGMEKKDVVGWNSLLLGYVQGGEETLALELLSSMDCVPDERTFIAGFKACTGMATKEAGTQVDGQLYKLASLDKVFALHRQAAERGRDSDVFLGSILMKGYATCGSLADSLRVFETMPHYNVLSWNALMLGYVENGETELALELLSSMEECKPNAQTYVAALKACIALAAAEQGTLVDGKLVKVEALSRGRAINLEAVGNGYGLDRVIAGTLLNMYARCGSDRDARKVFNDIPTFDRDIVLWNTLLQCYVDSGEEKLGLEAFWTMNSQNRCRPDAGTFVAVLKACGNIASMDCARQIFVEITRYGMEDFDQGVANSLVDVFGKCGSMIHSQFVFDSLATRDTVTWNSLLAGYSRQGSTSMVLSLFYQMLDENLEVNGVTFVSLLTACSHAGYVDKARQYLSAMTCVYGIRPGMEHYHCVVDALGRANQLDAAVSMVQSMPLPSSALTWFTILAACQKWNDVRRARVAMRALVEAPGSEAVIESAYALMSKLTDLRPIKY